MAIDARHFHSGYNARHKYIYTQRIDHIASLTHEERRRWKGVAQFTNADDATLIRLFVTNVCNPGGPYYYYLSYDEIHTYSLLAHYHRIDAPTRTRHMWKNE
jgi:hypothetical protein